MKKCPFCTKYIQDDAIVCHHCFRKLPDNPPIPGPQPAPTAQAPLFSASERQSGPKKAWLAVLLNLFPVVMGLGYIYLGLIKRFLLVFAVQFLSLFFMTLLGLREYNTYLLGALWVFTLIDAYVEAVYRNKKISSQNTPPPPPGARAA